MSGSAEAASAPTRIQRGLPTGVHTIRFFDAAAAVVSPMLFQR